MDPTYTAAFLIEYIVSRWMIKIKNIGPLSGFTSLL